MNLASLHDGCIALGRKQSAIEKSETAVIRIDDDECPVKRFSKMKTLLST